MQVAKSPSAFNSFCYPKKSIYLKVHFAGLSISANWPGKDNQPSSYTEVFFDRCII